MNLAVHGDIDVRSDIVMMGLLAMTVHVITGDGNRHHGMKALVVEKKLTQENGPRRSGERERSGGGSIAGVSREAKVEHLTSD